MHYFDLKKPHFVKIKTPDYVCGIQHVIVSLLNCERHLFSLEK